MAEKSNHWKTIAIIFIVLFVLETIFLIWAFSAGTSMINNENECAINICGDVEEAVSYYYDDYEQICYCMDADGETVKQQFIK